MAPIGCDGRVVLVVGSGRGVVEVGRDAAGDDVLPQAARPTIKHATVTTAKRLAIASPPAS
jgi:hypothetical protein